MVNERLSGKPYQAPMFLRSVRVSRTATDPPGTMFARGCRQAPAAPASTIAQDDDDPQARVGG
jgi:hypothetical protein